MNKVTLALIIGTALSGCGRNSTPITSEIQCLDLPREGNVCLVDIEQDGTIDAIKLRESRYFSYVSEDHFERLKPYINTETKVLTPEMREEASKITLGMYRLAEYLKK